SIFVFIWGREWWQDLARPRNIRITQWIEFRLPSSLTIALPPPLPSHVISPRFLKMEFIGKMKT
ncbi:hypothetical protein ACQP3J_32745, partial [Escherichia coli]